MLCVSGVTGTTLTRMKRVLVFEAHGDDMEFLAGGTIAKFTSVGHEVTLVCATDNDKGSFELSAEELRAVRDNELQGAASVLGIGRVIALGYSDGDLAYDAPPRELRGQFMSIIREVRPDIVMTWDPFTPYEGHPDHRAVAPTSTPRASPPAPTLPRREAITRLSEVADRTSRQHTCDPAHRTRLLT